MYTKHFCNHYEDFERNLVEIQDRIDRLHRDYCSRTPIRELIDKIMMDISKDQESDSVKITKMQDELVNAVAYDSSVLIDALLYMLSYMKEANLALKDHDDSLQAVTNYAEELEEVVSHLQLEVRELQHELNRRQSAYVLIGKGESQGEGAVPGYEFAGLSRHERQKKSEQDYEDLPF